MYSQLNVLSRWPSLTANKSGWAVYGAARCGSSLVAAKIKKMIAQGQKIAAKAPRQNAGQLSVLVSTIDIYTLDFELGNET